MNWIDIVVLAILLVNVYLGWTKGFIRSLTNLISIIAGFIAAKLYYKEMFSFLNNQYDLFEKIKNGVTNLFSNIEWPQLEIGTVSTNTLQIEGDSELINNLLNKFVESDSFQNMITTNMSNVGDGFSTWLAENLLNVLSMLLVFVIVFIGVRIAGYLLSTIFKLPILNGVNKTSGFLFGLAKGAFLSMLFVVLLVLIAPLLSDLNLLATLEESMIGIYFYRYNLIMYIFESMI
jgi:uncharacterized membrane protein required for colicin V production